MTFYELLRPRGTKDFAESKILLISDVVNITFYNFTKLFHGYYNRNESLLYLDIEAGSSSEWLKLKLNINFSVRMLVCDLLNYHFYSAFCAFVKNIEFLLDAMGVMSPWIQHKISICGANL